MVDIREALLEVAETDNDTKIRSEAKSLATNELGDFEFLMSIVIWYEVLTIVNMVSKQLQSKDMIIDIAITQVKGILSYFEKYRDTGFSEALVKAKEIAVEMNVDPVFPHRREIRRKKHFDESVDDTLPLSVEESFRVKYFLYIVDKIIVSLNKRFKQYQTS